MRIAALLVAATLSLGARAAVAQPASSNPDANAKILSAKDHYAKGELGASLADLAEAYHLDPKPDLLYAMGHIEVELGDCAGAVAHYKQYLATNPSAKAATSTQAAIDDCNKKMGVTEPVTPKEPVVPPPLIKVEPPHKIGPTHETETVSRPFYKDGLGDGLAAGGVVAGGAGIVLYLLARKDIDDSEQAATLGDHDNLVNKAHDLREYAVIAGAVGGALAVGAVVRWSTHGGGTETRELELSLAPAPDGTGVGFAAFGRF
jgi:tetratricopeptide (TPR) repeat protein